MYLPFFFNVLLFSVQFFDFRYTILPRLIFFDCICHLKKSCEFNISRRLNVRCIKSKNILLCFIASSFWNSMLYLLQLRAIIYCSNNTSLLAILIHVTPISNGFIFLRWRSCTFVLLNFHKPVWILNMCKIQKTIYLPSADWMRTVFWQLYYKNTE